MEFSRYMNIQKLEPEDIRSATNEFSKETGDIFAKRDALFEKYLQQCPYKVGDHVWIKHRKHGWKRAKIIKICVNSLTGNYDFTFKYKDKKIPTGHIIDIILI